MAISFFSAIMSFYAVTLLLLVTYFYRVLRVGRFGIRQLYVVLALCIIRMVLPVELPFARGIYAGTAYNHLAELLFARQAGVFCIADALGIIWLVVALFLIGLNIYRAISFSNNMMEQSRIAGEEYDAVLDSVKRYYGKDIEVMLRLSDSVGIPLSFGFFKRRIILPNDLSAKENYYCLLHEYGHLVRCDVQTIHLTNLFCYIAWWNPFSYLLRVKMEETLELNCDDIAVEKMGAEERVLYLNTIVSIIKNSTVKSRRVAATSMGLVRLNNEQFIVKRFKNVADNTPIWKNRICNAFLTTLCVVVFIFSYAFVFQSQFELAENEYEGYSLSDEAYILYRDGVYELYDGERYIYTFDSPDSAEQLSEWGVKIVEGDE